MKKIVLLTLALLAGATSSFADPRDGRDPNPRDPRDRPPHHEPAPVDFDRLERRVWELERDLTVMRDAQTALTYRIEHLERGTYPQPQPQPQPPYPPAPAPIPTVANCMVVDGGFNKTFLGTGSNQMDAEYNARRACESSVSASFCSSTAILKCDDNLKSPYIQKFVCMINDSGFSKSFRGEGVTPVEAEARAKQACQTSVSPSFCGKVEPRCSASQ